jgi:ABC-type sugar transport system permease subunit
MGDINLPLLTKTSTDPGSAIDMIDEEEALNLPYTLGECVTYRYVPHDKRFNFKENMLATQEILEGRFHVEEFLRDVDEMNNPKYLKPPSFWVKFIVTFAFIVMALLISILLLLIWAMLILDLVFLVVSIYVIKKSVIFFWVWRVQLIEKKFFSGLDGVIKRLNRKYGEKGLEWSIGTYRRWIQLGMLKTEHNVLGDS